MYRVIVYKPPKKLSLRLLQSLGLRSTQDKLHRKDSTFLKELCEAQWVYSQEAAGLISHGEAWNVCRVPLDTPRPKRGVGLGDGVTNLLFERCRCRI